MGKMLTLHKWLGVSAALFLAIMAVTGIILDHQEHFGTSGTLAIKNSLGLARGTRIEAFPVSPSQALQLAFATLDERVTIDRLELRQMGGSLVYKLETSTDDEIYIDPMTGAVAKDTQSRFDLVRIAEMLHTGEGLLDFPWLYDGIALALLTLVLSGTSLFLARPRH
ncbi:MAG: PepSY-associated TM helix domain-containing protein [Candidatus Tectimicrobiota bacterium]